jgi:hypothetical protein
VCSTIRPRTPKRRGDVHARQLPLRARPLIVTSKKPFSAWGEVFGDDAVATAMIDRLVHHAEILSLTGDSYRLKTATSHDRRPKSDPTHAPRTRAPFNQPTGPDFDRP